MPALVGKSTTDTWRVTAVKHVQHASSILRQLQMGYISIAALDVVAALGYASVGSIARKYSLVDLLLEV